MPAGTELSVGTRRIDAGPRRQPGATMDTWLAQVALAIDPDGNHIEAECRQPATR